MKFMVECPLGIDGEGRAWSVPGTIADFAMALESSGSTPSPSTTIRRLPGNGCDAAATPPSTPSWAWGFCAAVTTRLRLMTALTVVPYRNPLLMAKSMTAVDVLSGGRATFQLGTGYLRSEFLVLGVDFEERNALFDEAIEVAKALWASDEVHYEGWHFTAHRPRPYSLARYNTPPHLCGWAETPKSLQSVARWGDGWAPLLGGGVSTSTTRTATIRHGRRLPGSARRPVGEVGILRAQTVRHRRHGLGPRNPGGSRRRSCLSRGSIQSGCLGSDVDPRSYHAGHHRCHVRRHGSVQRDPVPG